MASSATALLLPLTLLLHFAAAFGQSQIRMKPKEVTAILDKPVTLICEVLLSDLGDSCSWVFQRSAAASPTFLLYLSKTRNQVDSPLNSGKRVQEKVFSLTLHHFREEDQGYYFCVVVGSLSLHFSPSVPVFLPAKPTTMPAPRRPSAAPTTAPQPRSLRPEVCRPSGGAAGEARAVEPRAAHVVGKRGDVPGMVGGMGSVPGPAPKWHLRSGQWTRGGWTSPVTSTSGRPWLGPARSFSYHWSSPSSATTVSPGVRVRRRLPGSFPPRLAPGGACRELGWRFGEASPSCLAGPRAARFAPLFPRSGRVLEAGAPGRERRQQEDSAGVARGARPRPGSRGVEGVAGALGWVRPKPGPRHSILIPDKGAGAQALEPFCSAFHPVGIADPCVCNVYN
uniref:T-cell surface glycoprotein CD8 alpha chain n=1 Tax=Oryctolagus cuniculus TaxID=9986 RepID=A0A5F9DHI5_RABIT